jgi:hypothetical protein
VDFKFQNSGDATAFLWKFAIRVVNAEIDKTPVLSFSNQVSGDALEVKITNDGWGAACDGRFRLQVPVLDALFPESVLRQTTSIASGASQSVFRLTKALAVPGKWEANIGSRISPFERCDKDFRAWDPSTRGRSHRFGLEEGSVDWECRSEDSEQKHQGQSVIRFENPPIVLTPNGFSEIDVPPCAYSPAASDVTYISMLDPFQSEHERVYSISRKIGPGEVERFHIMIGARMSCHLKVKFGFFIDKIEFIESEDFEIHIWNPRNSVKGDYQDGSELQRELDNLHWSAKVLDLPSWHITMAEEIQRRLASYPFSVPRRGGTG